VRRQVAEEAARGSFDEAVKAIDLTTGAEVAKRQVEQSGHPAVGPTYDSFLEPPTVVVPGELHPVNMRAGFFGTSDRPARKEQRGRQPQAGTAKGMAATNSAAPEPRSAISNTTVNTT
jgi:hypothetical protein